MILRKTALVSGMICLWIGAVGAGMRGLHDYANRPGEPSAAVGRWPKTVLERDPDLATLVLFAHPQCPCTRATLEELGRLLAAAGPNRPSVRIVFSSSKGDSRGKLWPLAAEIPGVRVVADPGGRIAREFGARTSGQVLLYSKGGDIQFKGGITPARGEVGQSSGKRAVVALLTGDRLPEDIRSSDGVARSKVFGCALFSESDVASESTRARESGASEVGA